MEDSLNFPQLLERIMYPAFLTESGKIIHANRSAIQHQIPVGNPVSELITIGAEEYEHFCGGTLCLTLTVCDIPYSTSVVRDGKYDIFYLDPPTQAPELQAFALAAQQLREPLSNAMSCTSLLLPNGAKDTQQLELLNRNLYQLHRALCNMSDAAQYEEIRASQTEYQDVTALFDEYLEKAALLAEKCGRTLSYKKPKSAVHTLLDAEKIERAVYNLISNAIKNTPQGGVIETQLHRSGNKLYFTVQDGGIGVADNNIFSRYLREPGLESCQAGLGLGLTIVRKAAAAHGGTLLLEQPENSGAKFTMSIRIHQSGESLLRSPVRLPVDYAGGYDHALTELSDILPSELYDL